MRKYLIIYSSIDGHTKKICKNICNQIKKNNIAKIVSLSLLKEEDLIISDFVIIGASVRYGKHRKELYNIISKYKLIISERKSAFFSVNVVARKKNKSDVTNNPYLIKFLKLSKWKPDYIEVFAGKIEYKRYSFIDKNIIKFIMWLTDGPTDINKTYDFTDWNRVNNFTKKLLEI